VPYVTLLVRCLASETCVSCIFFQTLPFFGVLPVLLDENGKEIRGPGEGYLVFRRPWPGIMRTLFANHERFETTYFKKFPGYYCTGDGMKHRI
jgi:acetyl-CoA synthetase